MKNIAEKIFNLLKGLLGKTIRRKVHEADAEDSERKAHDVLDDFSRRD